MGDIEDMYADSWSPAEVLAADSGGRALAAMRDALLQSRARLKAAVDKGVSPDEFKKAEALLGAFDAAASGLEKSWKQRHKT